MTNESCSTCAYYLPNNNNEGLCCRFPPITILIGHAPVTQSFFPVLKNTDWCGEHKGKLNG